MDRRIPTAFGFALMIAALGFEKAGAACPFQSAEAEIRNGADGSGRSLPRATRLDCPPIGWELWWHYNKEPILDLRRSIQRVAQASQRQVDAGIHCVLRRLGPVEPTRQDLLEVVTPALSRALADTASCRDVRSACMIAAARIGVDRAGYATLEALLADPEQETSEIAALAIGISQREEGVGALVALATDSDLGRTLVRRGQVPMRTRAFACYGLGLAIRARPEPSVARRVFETMQLLLAAKDSGMDLAVAGMQAMRHLSLDPVTPGCRVLRAEVLDYLLAYLADDTRPDLARAHACQAIASVSHRDDANGMVVAQFVAILEAESSSAHLKRSVALGLGEVTRSDQAVACRVLQNAVRAANDAQTRSFAAIALGRIGGARNIAFLSSALEQAADDVAPWLALALAAMGAGRDAGARELETASLVVYRRCRAAKSPHDSAGLALALALLHRRGIGRRLAEDDIVDVMIERMHRWRRSASEAAGFHAVALAMMGIELAREDIRAPILDPARPMLALADFTAALGLLGDQEAGLQLIDALAKPSSTADFAARARAIAHVRDRRVLPVLAGIVGDRAQPGIKRALAADALGRICERAPLPWNCAISVGINYRAATETLSGPTGVLMW